MDNLLLALEASGIGVQQCWYVAGWISACAGTMGLHVPHLMARLLARANRVHRMGPRAYPYRQSRVLEGQARCIIYRPESKTKSLEAAKVPRQRQPMPEA